MIEFVEIVDGKVMVGGKKPDTKDKDWYSHEEMWEFVNALNEWEAGLKPVVNAHVSQHQIEGHDEISIMKPVFEIVESGQKVETKQTPEGKIITKIL